MLQQRKKDYLQRIIEEFFSKLERLLNAKEKKNEEEVKVVLDESFQFFFDNFAVISEDTSEEIVAKIDSFELSEHYAKLLLMDYELKGNKNTENLKKAISIIEYSEKTDKTFSWSRNILLQDTLRLLEKSITLE